MSISAPPPARVSGRATARSGALSRRLGLAAPIAEPLIVLALVGAALSLRSNVIGDRRGRELGRLLGAAQSAQWLFSENDAAHGIMFATIAALMPALSKIPIARGACDSSAQLRRAAWHQAFIASHSRPSAVRTGQLDGMRKGRAPDRLSQGRHRRGNDNVPALYQIDLGRARYRSLAAARKLARRSPKCAPPTEANQRG